MNGLRQTTCGNMNVWNLSPTDANAVARVVRNWWPGHTSDRFPGPQPVSIERKHIQQLKSGDYRVCEKTDGERYLFACLIHDGFFLTVLINRKQEITLLPLTCETKVFNGTLLDGELVHDKVLKGYKFMVYDCIRANGTDTSSESLDNRILTATSVLSQFKDAKGVRLTFQVKQLYPLNEMKHYVNVIVPTLTHEIDGYIFTPNLEPVKTGTHYTLYKWKHGLNNTVDFSVTGSPPYRAHVMKNGRQYQLPTVYIDIPAHLSVDAMSIIECKYVSDHKWVAIRIRRDKTHPNSYLTYTKTVLNIKEDIQLVEFYHG